MTFGAMSAWQAWVLLAGSGALAAWLFLRKLRPPRLLVASLLLWRRVLDESRELTLWERIRRAVSLVVTLAIALALAFAATRPSSASAAPAVSRGRVLIVVDSSWSMLTRTGSGETRWARAAAQARRLAASGSGDEVALATTADGLVEGPTTDLALVETAIDRIAPGGGEASSWPQLAGADVVHFITDGTVARPLERGVVVHSVFEPAANVAITAFDVRPSLAQGNAGDAYLEIVNFCSVAQKVHLTLTRGTAMVVDRQLEMGPGEALRQVVPLIRGGEASLRAHVGADRNALAIDDEAFGWIDRAAPLAVTVVGQHTEWLRPLLTGDPDVRATFVDPAAYESGSDPRGAPPEAPKAADLVIFDRWAPGDPPARPAIFVAPPAETWWLADPHPVSGTSPSPSAVEEKRPHWEAPGTHPVVRGVDPLTFSIEKARAYRAPDLIPVAFSAQGTPLVLISQSSGRRVVVAFGPGESNLSSAPGFPVLIGNAFEWLVRPEARGARTTGMASFGDATTMVTGPGGAQVPLARVNGAALGILRAPGLYVAEGGGAESTFAVNVGDPQVSNVGRTSLTATDLARPVMAGAAGRPWWLYFASAAFLLALAEWWTWQRRITV